MRKTLILAGALGALALPAAAQAHHSGTNSGTRAAAVKACRAERGTTDASKAAFAAKYGTNAGKHNAFGKCVSMQMKAKAKKHAHRQSAGQSTTGGDAQHAAAVQSCRDERGTTDASKAAFAAKYGTNHNKRNAFGKCVSAQAKAQNSASGQDDNASDGTQGKPPVTGRNDKGSSDGTDCKQGQKS